LSFAALHSSSFTADCPTPKETLLINFKNNQLILLVIILTILLVIILKITDFLYGIDGPGIEFRWRRDFPNPSRPALRTTKPPIQRVQGLFAGCKAAGAWR
jgi:hypothetical protein